MNTQEYSWCGAKPHWFCHGKTHKECVRWDKTVPSGILMSISFISIDLMLHHRLSCHWFPKFNGAHDTFYMQTTFFSDWILARLSRKPDSHPTWHETHGQRNISAWIVRTTRTHPISTLKSTQFFPLRWYHQLNRSMDSFSSHGDFSVWAKQEKITALPIVLTTNNEPAAVAPWYATAFIRSPQSARLRCAGETCIDPL